MGPFLVGVPWLSMSSSCVSAQFPGYSRKLGPSVSWVVCAFLTDLQRYVIPVDTNFLLGIASVFFSGRGEQAIC